MNEDKKKEHKEQTEEDSVEQFFFCAECGGKIEDLVKSKTCSKCNLRYHLDTSAFGKICGFPTPDSTECKSCIYREHTKMSVKSSKKSIFSSTAAGFILAIFAGLTVYFGFLYLDGDYSQIFNLVIFGIGTLILAILFFRGTSGTTV